MSFLSHILIALGCSIVAFVIALVLLDIHVDFRQGHLFCEPKTLTVGR